jgi:hypothetical protein
MTDHTGTHVDAPFHHDDEGATIDRMPIDAFAGPALFMDLREQVEAAMEIGPRQLESWRGELRPGDFAILVTGWGDKRGVTSPPSSRAVGPSSPPSRSCSRAAAAPRPARSLGDRRMSGDPPGTRGRWNEAGSSARTRSSGSS